MANATERIFFFSSRRRHTRLQGDWSSDVCSSDLGTLLAAACGLDQATEDFDEDDLYAAMDQLNGHWVGIEKQLYQKSFPQGVSLVLYDLTSVYFEGNGPSRISQYGHSRDHRSDRP